MKRFLIELNILTTVIFFLITLLPYSMVKATVSTSSSDASSYFTGQSSNLTIDTGSVSADAVQASIDKAAAAQNAYQKAYDNAQKELVDANGSLNNAKTVEEKKQATDYVNEIKNKVSTYSNDLTTATFNLATQKLKKGEIDLQNAVSPEDKAKAAQDIEVQKNVLLYLSKEIDKQGFDSVPVDSVTILTPEALVDLNKQAQSAIDSYNKEYVTLEPGLWKETGVLGWRGIPTNALSDFLSKIFNFGIAIAVALSVIMITVGGIQYMTTDSWMKKENGKERIRNAFYGLGLALISWLILYTINPDLVSFNNNQLVSPTTSKTTK